MNTFDYHFSAKHRILQIPSTPYTLELARCDFSLTEMKN